MPVPCAACASPVHETAVRCPHCGDATGIAPTSELTDEERQARAQIALAALAHQEAEVDTRPYTSVYSPELLVAEAMVAVARVVGAAVETVAEHADRAAEPELPRAEARFRPQRRAETAEPARAPEPAPPPGDEPRFLK